MVLVKTLAIFPAKSVTWGYVTFGVNGLSESRAGRFESLLRSAGLTKIELAHRLGKRESSVCRWGDKVPEYALAYLELMVASKPRPTDWQVAEDIQTNCGKLIE